MSTVLINHTNDGSHGMHWLAVFDQDAPDDVVIKRIIDAVGAGNKKEIDGSVAIVTDCMVRTIIQDKSMVSAFPYVKSTMQDTFTIRSITEWSHVSNLEATINAVHGSGCSLSFFPTDYTFNKEGYTQTTPLPLSIIGLAYAIIAFDPTEFNKNITSGPTFDHNFCGYFPRSNDACEIEFVGHIRTINEFALGELPGFMLTVGITPDFNCDFFVAQKNLSTTLEVGKNIRGVAWMQGTLEK